MKSSITRLFVLAGIAVALAGSPVFGQVTNKAPAEKKTAAQPDSTVAEKPGKGGPFHGKLAAVDKVAKTITVGKRTFQITAQTKIKKSGKPATLEDGIVGDAVSGYIKPSAEGKLTATTINFGPKIGVEGAEKGKTEKQKEAN